MTDTGHPDESAAPPGQPGDGDDDPGHAAGMTAPGWPALIVLTVLVAGLIVIGWLAVRGAAAASLVAVLGLLIAFVAVMGALVAKYVVPTLPFIGEWPWRFWILVGLGAPAASAVVIIALSPLVSDPPVPSVLGSIRVDGSDELTPATPATIVFPGPTPERQYLGLQLHLDDYIGSGDCMRFATLTLTPSKSGQEGESIQVPKSATASQTLEYVDNIPVGGSVQDLRIGVALHSDVGCKLRLVVHEAVFHG